MKTLPLILGSLLFNWSCSHTINPNESRNEILSAEKAFEKMVSEKGLAQAFYYFADTNAVIKRENDTIITGKNNIKKYYEGKNIQGITLNWTPDFIDVSDCGTLGYTYGRYTFKKKNIKGDTSEYKGVFHTVW